MTQSAPQNSPIPEDMLNAIIKTFIVQHVDDTDEHLAQALVYNASRLAYRMREAGVTTEYKTSLTDVVTAADRAAEKFVADALRAIRPDDGLLGEEGTRVESKSGRTWVIDPLDGTFNFTVGSDYWCAAVALVEGDPANPTKLLFGAVHRPAMGYTWFGGPTIPTTCDGKTIHVADAEPAALALSGAFHANQTETWKHVLPMFATARMNGSASVDLAGVAGGAAGCWLQHSLPAWDWLPGRALVEGAGGVTEAVPVGDVVWYVAGGEQAVSAVVAKLRSVGASAGASAGASQEDNTPPADVPTPTNALANNSQAATLAGAPAGTATANAGAGADGGAYAADLALALELADLADSITMDRFEAVDLHIESKPDLTPVSDADTTVEEQLRAILATKRPDDAILGEEFGGEVALQGRQWVIDPIDGTKNFVRGVPVWATLISLLVDGKPVVGVVSAPALNRRWWAATGSGAYRSPDNRRLTTSNVSNLADASISISSLTGWEERGLREELIALTDHAWRLRGFGDFWSYMLVAEGTVDVAAEPEVSLWDLAALVPIVEEAGGTFTNIEGAPGPHGGSAIATNTHLHDAVLRAIQP